MIKIFLGMLFVVALMTLQLQQQSMFFANADGEDATHDSVKLAGDEPVLEQNVPLSDNFKENSDIPNAFADSKTAAQDPDLEDHLLDREANFEESAATEPEIPHVIEEQDSSPPATSTSIAQQTEVHHEAESTKFKWSFSQNLPLSQAVMLLVPTLFIVHMHNHGLLQ